MHGAVRCVEGTARRIDQATVLEPIERALGWSRQLRLTPLRPPAYIAIKLLIAMLLGLASVVIVYTAGAFDGVHVTVVGGFDDLEVAIPAFLTIILMPFTYSITAGIGAGFVSFVVLKVVRGKAGQIHPLMWIVSALFVVYFAIGPLGDWLT